jgi:hypothetical protein
MGKSFAQTARELARARVELGRTHAKPAVTAAAGFPAKAVKTIARVGKT